MILKQSWGQGGLGPQGPPLDPLLSIAGPNPLCGLLRAALTPEINQVFSGDGEYISLREVL